LPKGSPFCFSAFPFFLFLPDVTTGYLSR
jgi:hypothetical protein